MWIELPDERLVNLAQIIYMSSIKEVSGFFEIYFYNNTDYDCTARFKTKEEAEEFRNKIKNIIRNSQPQIIGTSNFESQYVQSLKRCMK